MREFQRDTERKPVKRFGGDSGRDRPRGNFRKDSDESPRRSGSRAEGGFRRDSDRPKRLEMFRVVCDKCKKECEVPFKPTSSKPVYCSDCFKKNDSPSGRSNFESKGRSYDSSKGRSYDSAGDTAKIHEKLDKIIKALGIED